jgi:hypothetical protein
MVKLGVQPGDYSCTWSMDGKTIAGQVDLRASERPVGHVFDLDKWTFETSDSGEEIRSFSGPVDEKLPVVRGTLRDNRDVVLMDATLSHWMPDRAFVRAEMALCGLSLPAQDPLLFDSISFQVGGLTELSGVRPIKSKQVPRNLGTQVRPRSGTPKPVTR